MNKGSLFLIPAFLAPSAPEKVFPLDNMRILQSLDVFIVEELRSARRFLRQMGYSRNFDEVVFHLLNEHTDKRIIPDFLLLALQGKNIGLISEAGLPCVADPGSEIVRIAHNRGIPVVPLVGPSSIFLALMASGFNGQNFVFHGYLPVEIKSRLKKIREMEQKARRLGQTQIFMETPYRNNKLFTDITGNCSPDTLLCIAADLTGENQKIESRTILEWRKIKPDLNKRPAIFLVYYVII